MQNKKNSKINNIEKVRVTIKEMDKNFFTNYEISQKTGLNYEQIKRILKGLEEIEEVKYMEATKVYVRRS